MPKNRNMSLVVGTMLLCAGATVAQAADVPATAPTQPREQEQARKQAISSIKKREKENPRDQGLRRAEQCLAHSEQCRDLHGLDQAMESVRRNMEKHPDDAGLRHALAQLESHHERLEQQHMERGRHMHEGGSTRPDRPDNHGDTKGMHRKRSEDCAVDRMDRPAGRPQSPAAKC